MRRLLVAVWVAVLIGQMTALAACQPEAQSPEPGSTPVQGDIKDVVYKSVDGIPLELDLYGAQGPGPHPLVIWVHGGGWVSGDKSQCLPVRLGLPAHGYTIACVNYRLSSQAVFPAQIEDVRDAVAFLREHAATYHLDPDRFAAWGSSAGGHLVALLGTTSGSPVFTPDAAGSAVQAVVDFYGPIDLVAMAETPGYTAHARPDSLPSRLLGGPVLENPDKARQANPVTYASAGDPPFLIVHGTADRLVPPAQSQLLHDALQRAGVPTTLHLIPDARHGGPEYASADTTALVLDFLAETLQARITHGRTCPASSGGCLVPRRFSPGSPGANR